jgi:hypothetical protein
MGVWGCRCALGLNLFKNISFMIIVYFICLSQISLNNVVMELRKLCGHPYLLPGVEEETKKSKDTYKLVYSVTAHGWIIIVHVYPQDSVKLP